MSVKPKVTINARKRRPFRKVVWLTLLFALIAPASYIAAPFYTAWSIREAVKSGDSAYLSRKIDFEGVRRTLRPSLATVAFDIPDPSSNEPAPKPGLWKRFKAYWGQSAIDRFVNSYVTPEGLPQMFEWRRTYREVTGAVDPNAAKPPLLKRLASFWSRLKRAEFKSPTELEFEMRDQYDATRSHIGLLVLQDPVWSMDWKLTELRVRVEPSNEDAQPEPEPQFLLESNAALPTDR